MEKSPSRARPTVEALEGEIVAIWKDLLQVQSIRTSDEFVAQGATSLDIFRLSLALERVYGTPVPASVFFKARSLHEFVGLLHQTNWP